MSDANNFSPLIVAGQVDGQKATNSEKVTDVNEAIREVKQDFALKAEEAAVTVGQDVVYSKTNAVKVIRTGRNPADVKTL